MDVVVGTPGRIIDLIDRGSLELQEVRLQFQLDSKTNAAFGRGL